MALNTPDLNAIQDYKATRKCFLVRESGVSALDLDLGRSVSEVKSTLVASASLRPLNILFFGRFLLEKGIHDFLAILEYTHKLGIDCTFTIAGSIDSNSSSVDSVWLSSLSRSISIMDSPDYTSVFETADILAFPSYREGHPLYLLRAMAFGVVPIVYNVPGSTVDVLHMYNGLISPSLDPSGLASSINYLASDRHLLCELSRNARNYALRSTQALADQHLHDLLSNGLPLGTTMN